MSNWTALGAVVLIAAVIRGVVLIAMFGQLQGDPDAYREIANNLLRHGSFALDVPASVDGGHAEEPRFKATAYRPPLYPCLLAVANFGLDQVSPVRVALLHWLLGMASVAVTFLVARNLGLGRGAFFAALLVALDPILLNQSTLVMTETLATLLAVLAIFMWQRFSQLPSSWNAAIVGAVVGLAALCRPTFLPWLAMLLLLIFLDRRVLETTAWSFWPRVGRALIIACSALLVLSPWIARNYVVFGKPIIATTHGGYTLLLGNNPAYYRYLQSDDQRLPWAADDPEFQAMLPQPPPPTADELRYDSATKRLAYEAIQSQPMPFVRASVDRVFQLWNPLPNRTRQDKSLARQLLRYATCAWYVVVYSLAILGMAKLRGRLLHRTWLAALLLCLAFTLMHSVYWSNLRMRAPLMPVIALLAGVGLSSLASRQKLPVGQRES